MNRYLQDVLDQLGELQKVLQHAGGPGRSDLRRASEAIGAAPRVVVTSMGGALYSCMPMYGALSRCHPNVHLMETSELLLGAPHSAQTTYVVMSRSGESGEVARFAEEIRKQSGALIAVTMTPDSTLARCADIVVHDTAALDGMICTKAFSSMALLGLLVASELVGEFDGRLAEALHRHFAHLEGEKSDLLSRLRATEALARAEVVHFLSEGVGMTVAAMGALLMQEGAWLPSVAQGFGMFHHGGIEVVDRRFVGFWIDLVPNRRSLELYEELSTKGGDLIVVSPEAGPYGAGFRLPCGSLPEAYRIFSAAMVVQLAAYCAGEARGHEAGEMRYVNWLVK